MNVQNGKNVQFKAKFLIDNPQVLKSTGIKLSRKSKILVDVMKRDGTECHCCKRPAYIFVDVRNNTASFTLKRTKFEKIRMTIDHDLLDTLGGKVSAENSHMLCYSCNQLRDSLFAGYEEFKEWYDNTISTGKCAPREIKKVQVNYCHIDFERNFVKGSIQRSVCIDVNKIPLPIQSKFNKNYLCNSKFSCTDFDLHILRNYTEKAWDNYLNELLVTIIKHRQNINVEVPSFKFNVTNIRSSSTVGFVNKLSTIFTPKLNDMYKIHVHPVQNDRLKAKHKEKNKLSNRIIKAFSILFG